MSLVGQYLLWMLGAVLGLITLGWVLVAAFAVVHALLMRTVSLVSGRRGSRGAGGRDGDVGLQASVVGAQAFRTRPGILRPLAAAVLLLTLVGWIQTHWVVARRAAVMGEEPEFNGELALKMPALALTGLRGPLVTALWLAAEEDKQNRNWEALQTYYGAIAALQPHFAQGYLMNGWNSAYNMSAQFNLLATKYLWIRKGVELTHAGDARNPDDIDLVGYLSDLYGDKLGRSYEKMYYGMRFREDTKGSVMPTLPPDPSAGREVDQVTGQALGKPLPPPPPGAPPQFPCGETFPFGVSPLGYGWFYAEKARRIQAATGAKHNQFGAPVISSRPTLMMRDWAYREHELARLRAREVFDGRPYELDFIGLNADEKREILRRRRTMESLIEEVRWQYKFSIRLFEQLISEYREHVRRFGGKLGDDDSLYNRHMQNAWFDRRLVQGHAEAFEGLLIAAGRVPGTVDEAAARFQAAEEHYRAALGDAKKYDLSKPETWRGGLEIGMEPYMEALLPPGDPTTRDNRNDVLKDIAYYRSLIRVMADCRREARARHAEPLQRIFTRKLMVNLIGWVILRDPPRPMGT